MLALLTLKESDKMNIQAGCNIHNRFDIEVRDKNTGELKQKGQAENIVLDRMYTRLRGFAKYFDNIHFGSGTGTLDPTRTTLFSSLGYKESTTEETIKSFPISKWTRKITLAPEEYVGQTITEVGISETTSAINTHAMITDSEGNPLSVTKTDIDVIIIYAIVFIEFQNKSENIYFTGFPLENTLLNYLTGDTLSTSQNITASSNELYFSGGYPSTLGYKSSTGFTSDRKRIYETRFGISEANGDLREIKLGDILTSKLPEPSIFTEHVLSDIILGTGDGVTTEFAISHSDIDSLVCELDGAYTTDYSLIIKDRWFNIETPVKYTKTNYDMSGFNATNTHLIVGDYYYQSQLVNQHYCAIYYIDQNLDIIYLKHYRTNSSPRQTSNGKYLRLGDTYLELFDGGVKTISSADLPEGTTFVSLSNTNGDIMRITEGSNSTALVGIKSGNYYSVNFNTPPPEGAVITADYTVPYIPKSEDYVLDVTMEIQFGEGV